MSTLQERLREEMARSVAAVRPAPDPLGRLLRRQRRRAWRWGATALGALAAAAALGAQTLVAPAGPAPKPTPEHRIMSGHMLDEPLTEWTRRIIDAPTRGNAADEPGLTDALAAGVVRNAWSWNARPGLDRVKVLFVADQGGERMFGAALYNDQRALYVGSFGPAGVSVEDLVGARYGASGGALSPFSVHVGSGTSAIGLAPPGCTAEWAATTRVGTDGTLEHTWTGGGDFVTGAPREQLWRVTCDGVVREVQYHDVPGAPGKKGSPPPAEPGHADPEIAKEVLWAWPKVPGLDVRSRRILWGGTPPGERRPVVVGLGELGDGSVQVCAVTGTGGSILVDRVHGEPPSGARGFPTARLTTAVAPSDAIVAVRLPADERIELSERLLVIAPPGATELRVAGGEAEHVALAGGVAVLVAPVPATLGIEALDATGRTLATLKVAEPHTDRFLAGQGLVRNWE
ncbi:hypothetical protein [Dactylosporangium sp. NPDC051484]|uniref:hypothetical protein n=1 Tax=Dactylosporangium sp. NPDC051484 TaxID=3154942 RepID=UPI00344B4485